MSIVQIAQVAGVSHSTVSRVINNNPNVRQDTAKRVKQAMSKIGYIPKHPDNRPGPRLSNHSYCRIRTGNIAVVFHRKLSILANSPILATVLHGVERALAQKGLTMIVGNSKCSPLNVAKGQVDGALIFDFEHDIRGDQMCQGLGSCSKVFVMTGNTRPVDRVLNDNYAIGKLAAEYLLGRGHKHIAIINVDEKHPAYNTRGKAFQIEAERGGTEVSCFAESVCGTELIDHPYLIRPHFVKLVDSMFKSSVRPAGLFLPCDAMAALIYPILASRGIRPGADIDIIACNNEVSLLAGLHPRPATIDINAELIGQRAVEQLLWRLNNPDDPTRIKIEVEPKLILPRND